MTKSGVAETANGQIINISYLCDTITININEIKTIGNQHRANKSNCNSILGIPSMQKIKMKVSFIIKDKEEKMPEQPRKNLCKEETGLPLYRSSNNHFKIENIYHQNKTAKTIIG
jgi:hypothetical protein